MTRSNRIIFKTISAAIGGLVGLLLFTLTFFITSINSVFILVGLSGVAILIFAIFLIFNQTNRTNLTKTTVCFALIFAIWFITTLSCYKKVFSGQSTTEYVVEKIDDFKKEVGRYPLCKNSNELIDSIGLNLNYISPEDFSYNLKRDSNYYILVIYESNKSVVSTYDSRTKQETVSKK